MRQMLGSNLVMPVHVSESKFADSDNRLRILFIDGSEAPLFFGSAASLTYRGHEVFMLDTRAHNTSLIRESRKVIDVVTVESEMGRADIRVVNFPLPYRGFERIGLLVNLYEPLFELLDHIQPDVVVGYYYGNNSWWYFYPILKKLDVPSVGVIYGIRGFWLPEFISFTHDYHEIFRGVLNIIHTATTSHLSDFVITSSTKYEKILRKIGVRHIATIPPTYVRIVSKVKQNIPEISNPFVLSLITISRRGNTEFDIASLRILLSLARLMPNIKFVLAGSSMAELYQLCNKLNLSIPKNVIPLGFIRDTNALSQLYEKASCVIHPWPVPWSWGTSIRIVESLFYGKAMVTTRSCASFLQGLIHGKHIILINDFSEYKEWITKVCFDDEFRKRIEAGAKEYYRTNLSQLIHGKRLEHFLINLVHMRSKK